MFLNFYGSYPPHAACHDGEGLRFLKVILIAALIAATSGPLVRWIVNRGKRTGG